MGASPTDGIPPRDTSDARVHADQGHTQTRSPAKAKNGKAPAKDDKATVKDGKTPAKDTRPLTSGNVQLDTSKKGAAAAPGNQPDASSYAGSSGPTVRRGYASVGYNGTAFHLDDGDDEKAKGTVKPKPVGPTVTINGMSVRKWSDGSLRVGQTNLYGDDIRQLYDAGVAEAKKAAADATAAKAQKAHEAHEAAEAKARAVEKEAANYEAYKAGKALAQAGRHLIDVLAVPANKKHETVHVSQEALDNPLSRDFLKNDDPVLVARQSYNDALARCTALLPPNTSAANPRALAWLAKQVGSVPSQVAKAEDVVSTPGKDQPSKAQPSAAVAQNATVKSTGASSPPPAASANVLQHNPHVAALPEAQPAKEGVSAQPRIAVAQVPSAKTAEPAAAQADYLSGAALTAARERLDKAVEEAPNSKQEAANAFVATFDKTRQAQTAALRAANSDTELRIASARLRDTLVQIDNVRTVANNNGIAWKAPDAFDSSAASALAGAQGKSRAAQKSFEEAISAYHEGKPGGGAVAEDTTKAAIAAWQNYIANHPSQNGVEEFIRFLDYVNGQRTDLELAAYMSPTKPADQAAPKGVSTPDSELQAFRAGRAEAQKARSAWWTPEAPVVVRSGFTVNTTVNHAPTTPPPSTSDMALYGIDAASREFVVAPAENKKRAAENLVRQYNMALETTKEVLISALKEPDLVLAKSFLIKMYDVVTETTRVKNTATEYNATWVEASQDGEAEWLAEARVKMRAADAARVAYESAASAYYSRSDNIYLRRDAVYLAHRAAFEAAITFKKAYEDALTAVRNYIAGHDFRDGDTHFIAEFAVFATNVVSAQKSSLHADVNRLNRTHEKGDVYAELNQPYGWRPDPLMDTMLAAATIEPDTTNPNTTNPDTTNGASELLVASAPPVSEMAPGVPTKTIPLNTPVTLSEPAKMTAQDGHVLMVVTDSGGNSTITNLGPRADYIANRPNKRDAARDWRHMAKGGTEGVKNPTVTFVVPKGSEALWSTLNGMVDSGYMGVPRNSVKTISNVEPGAAVVIDPKTNRITTGSPTRSPDAVTAGTQVASTRAAAAQAPSPTSATYVEPNSLVVVNSGQPVFPVVSYDQGVAVSSYDPKTGESILINITDRSGLDRLSQLRPHSHIKIYYDSTTQGPEPTPTQHLAWDVMDQLTKQKRSYDISSVVSGTEVWVDPKTGRSSAVKPDLANLQIIENNNSLLTSHPRGTASDWRVADWANGGLVIGGLNPQTGETSLLKIDGPTLSGNPIETQRQVQKFWAKLGSPAVVTIAGSFAEPYRTPQQNVANAIKEFVLKVDGGKVELADKIEVGKERATYISALTAAEPNSVLAARIGTDGKLSFVRFHTED